jgi:hypothetical protein
MSNKSAILLYIPLILLVTFLTGPKVIAQIDENQLLYPVNEGGLWGFIDNTGSMVISPQFEAAAPFSEGLAEVGVGGKSSFVDTTGKVVFNTDFNFGDVELFREGFAAARNQNGWGFIDTKGRVIVTPQYTSVGDFSSGLAMVRTGDWAEGKAGYINVLGELVIPMNFYDGRPFSEGLAAVLLNGSWGFIGMTGDYVTDPQFVDVGYKYNEGVIEVEPYEDNEEGLWGYINDVGEYIIEPLYKMAGPFSAGLAPVQVDAGDPNGFIDHQGAMVIAPNYFALTSFFEGLATVYDENGQMGYINTSGNLSIPFQFSQAGLFRGGLAPVTNWSESMDPAWGYIDTHGNYVWGPVAGYWPQ